MTSLKVKKRLSYFTIGSMFFMGGIEYAVILPTLWLYLKTDFNAPEYMLGIMLSAFSLAAIISGPILGRWSDKFRKPKLLLLVGVLCEIGGNIMYFMGISVWFLVASRLVCGIGGGTEAVLMGEVTRTTSEEKRTGIISILVAIRQSGLLVGPGLNLFLREFDFYVHGFHVNKFNIPGRNVGIAVNWGAIYQLEKLFYGKPVDCGRLLCTLHPTEIRSQKVLNQQSYDIWRTQRLTKIDCPRGEHYEKNRKCIIPEIWKKETAFMACVWSLQIFILLFLYTDLHKLTPPTQKPTKLQNDIYKPNLHANYDENLDDMYRQLSNSDTHKKVVYGSEERSYSHDPDDLMETAENFIGQDSVYGDKSSGPSSLTNGSIQSPDIFDDNSVNVVTNYEQLENTLIVPNEEPLSRKESQEYIDSTEGTLNDYLQGRSKLKFLYHEYVREEIITVLAVQFNGFFNQIALETMATPLSDKLLNWGEMENSVMYCIAGVEIISVFFFVRWLSKHLQDRLLMLIGLLVLTSANCWLIYVIPLAEPHSPSKNLWKFAIALALDMFALPFLIATGVSLYSKLTKKETQGLSMGIRRSVIGLAMILAPLWAGSTIPYPYVLFGVMLGLLVMSLMMMTLSYTKLIPLSDVPENRAGIITSSNYSDENGERQPLL